MTEQLPTRELGTTGMMLTSVGIGTWAFGGDGWTFSLGAQDDQESVLTVNRAVERGINWLDTAAVYGLGHAEEVVGKAISIYSDADRPFIFTKGGRVWNDDDRLEPPRSVGAPASLRIEVENSLRRLGVDQIDLYQMHRPPDDVPLEAYWEVFLELKQQGKVRAIGLSNHTVPLLEKAEAMGHVDSLQPVLSAINDAAVDELLPWCSDHRVGVIAYSPMGSGLLTGAYTRERIASLAGDDFRHTTPAFTTDLDRNLGIAAVVQQIAAAHEVTPSSIAIAWVLAQTGVTGAIVGVRHPEEIEDWFDAGSVSLTADDLAAISSARHGS